MARQLVLGYSQFYICGRIVWYIAYNTEFKPSSFFSVYIKTLRENPGQLVN